MGNQEESHYVHEGLEYVGFLCTAIFYSSPCSLIYELVYKGAKVENTSFFVIIWGLIHAILWFTFGIVTGNELEIWSNFIGSLLCLIWLVIYLYFYANKNTIRYSLYVFTLIDVIFEIGFIEYDFLVSESFSFETKDISLRTFASVLNVMMFFTPGLNFCKLLRSRNFKKYINIYISFSGALNTIVWTFIGFFGNFLEKKIANITGLILCSLQIFFYFSNCFRVHEENEKENNLLDGLGPQENNAKDNKTDKKKRKKSSDVDKEVFEYI